MAGGRTGVQFRGVPEVMRAFDNIHLLHWAVKYDKFINMKYEGSGEQDSRATLEEYLHMLENSRSESNYTLCFYEDLPKGQKIKPSTEPDFAFNFTLWNAETYPNPYRESRDQIFERLLAKMDAIETKLALIESEEPGEEPERETGIMGFLNGIASDPQVKSQLINGILGLFKKSPIVPMDNRSPQTLGKIGGVETEEPKILLDEPQTLKLQEAVGILATVDPHLGDNLLKIARVAQTDKEKYSNLIALLNSLL